MIHSDLYYSFVIIYLRFDWHLSFSFWDYYCLVCGLGSF